MQKVSEYSLTSASDTASYSSRSPKSWVLYGESDGKWVSLSSVTDVHVDSGVEHRYSISNPNQYQKYKIEFQTNSSFQMADIKLYTDNQEKLTFYTTETQIVNSQTGATEEYVQKCEVVSDGMIIGSKNGRAIRISGGTLNLDGGFICNFDVSNRTRTSDSNVVNSAGGAICVEGGTVNLNGTVIAGNSARDGGGIYVGNGATLNLNGGCISGNTATGNGSAMYGGGGIYIYSSTVNVNSGYVTNNMGVNPTAPCKGGGTAMWNGSADGMAITSSDPNDVLTAASVMGLTSNPSSDDKSNASNMAKVFVNGNESITHGGGFSQTAILSLVLARLKVTADLNLKPLKK